MKTLFSAVFTLYILALYSQTDTLIYTVVLEDEIYIEKYDSSVVSNSKYTLNNTCYKNGDQLTYDYYYQSNNGKKYKFKPLEVNRSMTYKEKQSAWKFVSIDSLDDQTIDKILLTVDTNYSNILYSFPGFEQSVITYDYLLNDGQKVLFEGTGLVENEYNVWIHPPRNNMFNILEINPFPFIQAPYVIGNKWQWTLNKVSNNWADIRWREWEGIIDVENNYTITDITLVETYLGKMECYIIHATGTSPVGNSSLIAYFNIDIGFVKLDYTNVDSSKLVIEVSKVSSIIKQ